MFPTLPFTTLPDYETVVHFQVGHTWRQRLQEAGQVIAHGQYQLTADEGVCVVLQDGHAQGNAGGLHSTRGPLTSLLYNACAVVGKTSPKHALWDL